MPVILRTEGIVKRFEKVTANDSIDFELKKGQIHALLGENGSGKSTFLNVLYGVWSPNEGRIFIHDEEAEIRSPLDAIVRYRIGKVSQHSDLVPTFSVGENITFRKVPTWHGFLIDRGAIRKKVLDLLDIVEVKLDPDSIVETLSTGEQQQVELLKVLAQDAEIILLDETSALLAPHEVESLFSLLRTLSSRGTSIVFVTHKLYEALRCDRITVLREGKVTLTADQQEVGFEDLLGAMFNQRSINDRSRSSMPTTEQEIILEVRGICTGNQVNPRRSDLKNVSLSVHSGEILGIAGIAGNGQGILLDVITGFCHPREGQVLLKSEDITRFSSTHILRKKNLIAYIPEDRHKMGSLCTLPLTENAILGEGRKGSFFPRSIRHRSKISEFTKNLISEYEVKTAGMNVRADSLSGGNLQKVILGRELSIHADLVIASQPSRGLDFKTTEFVHQKLMEKRNQGKAVLLVSYDLDEIIKLSDRIVVMYEGALIEVPYGETDAKAIGRIMVGFYENKTEARIE